MKNMTTVPRSRIGRAVQIWVPELRHRQWKSAAALEGKNLSDFIHDTVETAINKRSKNKTNTAVPTTEQATA
jgi:uncharacterized protein (DUF1778 family)